MYCYNTGIKIVTNTTSLNIKRDDLPHFFLFCQSLHVMIFGNWCKISIKVTFLETITNRRMFGFPGNDELSSCRSILNLLLSLTNLLSTYLCTVNLLHRHTGQVDAVNLSIFSWSAGHNNRHFEKTNHIIATCRKK